MNPKTRRRFFLVFTTGIFALLALTGLASSEHIQAQLDPTAQQQTIDAVVFAYFTQTAQVQQALTATADFNATISARMQELQATSRAATLQAGGLGKIQVIDGVSMVWVPAGCFKMGSDPNIDKSAGTGEQPQRDVCITQVYWIDQLEVTNAAYQKFIDAGGYTNRAYWSTDGWQWKGNQIGPENYDGFTDPQQPRVVTWYEAEAYANWRGCRLPTEAEWEYAARGPNSPIYPWGNDFVPANLVYDGNSCNKTAVVGPNIRTAGASWVGALDMSGNVWEWVADWYQADYYKVGPKDDPTGPASGAARAVRGGSWLNAEDYARASYRYGYDPDGRHDDLGFRLFCAAPVSHLSDR